MLPPASNDNHLMNEHAYYERGVDDRSTHIRAPWTMVLLALLTSFMFYKVLTFVMKTIRKDRNGSILPDHAVLR